MTLYRDTTTSVIFTDYELLVSLGEEIDGLDDEDYLKQEVQLHRDAAIREYIIECCLVGIYSRLDGDAVVYRRIMDGELFYADEIEGVFDDDMVNLEPEHREHVTFDGWLSDKILNGLFDVPKNS
jgi:hypothetical protein